jgi:hypothetical protein
MKNKKMIDAVVVGSVEWESARRAAFEMSAKLQGEVAELQELAGVKDAYSPMAWLAICQHLRSVTDGMTVMRMLAEGKEPKQITAETGIPSGSVAAYQAWNTMYRRNVTQIINKRIRIKGKNEAEQKADIAFLRSCGIAFDVVPREASHD